MTDHGNIYGAVHFFNAAKEQRHQAHPRLRTLRLQSRRPSRRHAERQQQPPARARRKRRRLPQPDPPHLRSLAPRLLSQAARQQALPRRKLQRPHRLLRLPLAANSAKNSTPADYDKAKAAALQYQDIFGRGNFYLEIQDQGLEEEKKFRPTSSASKKNSTSRSSLPTTRITSAAKTRTRTT